MRSMMAIAALTALAPCAAAQPSGRPHPADPSAPAPTAKYESAITGYRSLREEPVAPWREVNDEAARAGGHVGIMRGAAGTAPSKPASATPARPGQQ